MWYYCNFLKMAACKVCGLVIVKNGFPGNLEKELKENYPNLESLHAVFKDKLKRDEAIDHVNPQISKLCHQHNKETYKKLAEMPNAKVKMMPFKTLNEDNFETGSVGGTMFSAKRI